MRVMSFLNRRQSSFLLAVGSLYIMTFVVVLPRVCRTWVYSFYFVPDATVEETVRRVMSSNDERLSQANEYLEKLRPSMVSSRFLARGRMKDVDLAIGIVTVNRENAEVWKLGYLTQVIAKLLHLAEFDTKFKSKVIIICNTDVAPAAHTEALRMSKFVKMAVRFNSTFPEGKPSPEVEEDIFEKEKQDYVFCLRQAAHYRPQHVIILEDDAYPMDTFFNTVHHILQWKIISKGLGRETQQRFTGDWIFAKLYHPERWRGYSSEYSHVLELAGIACLGWTFFRLFGECTMRSRSRRSWIVMVGALGASYSVCLVYTVGRPYVMSLLSFTAYTHRVVAAPGCCTSAVLYPSTMVESCADYLSSIRCHRDFSVDHALDWLAETNHYQRYLVEPNLVKHIGMWSSVRAYAKSAAEFA